MLFDQAGIPTTWTEEIGKHLWGKVLYNSALNPLSCLLEVSYGQLLENEHAKSVMKDVVEELFTVISRHKITVDWDKADDYTSHLFTQLIPPTRDHFSSMLQDIRHGKRTEIDALNGKVVAGEELEIDLPVNRYGMIGSSKIVVVETIILTACRRSFLAYLSEYFLKSGHGVSRFAPSRAADLHPRSQSRPGSLPVALECRTQVKKCIRRLFRVLGVGMNASGDGIRQFPVNAVGRVIHRFRRNSRFRIKLGYFLFYVDALWVHRKHHFQGFSNLIPQSPVTIVPGQLFAGGDGIADDACPPIEVRKGMIRIYLFRINADYLLVNCRSDLGETVCFIVSVFMTEK